MTPAEALQILQRVNPQAAAVLVATLTDAESARVDAESALATAIEKKNEAVAEKNEAVAEKNEAVAEKNEAVAVTLEMARAAAQLLFDRNRYEDALWLLLRAHSRLAKLTHRGIPHLLAQAANEFRRHSRAARQPSCGTIPHAKHPRHAPGRRSPCRLPAVPFRRLPDGSRVHARPPWIKLLRKFLMQ